MAYQINITKVAPCCQTPTSAMNGFVAGTPSINTIEVYGCTPDLTAGEIGTCTQGTYTPVGCCCAWTVPAGVTQIIVELWGAGGGGGSGASANCCGNSPGAGAGSYIKRQITVAPGDVMTICAGAGGCYGPNCDGTQVSFCCCGSNGSCSFVRRNGINCIDAIGGSFGSSCCYLQCGCTYNATCGNNHGVSGCSPCGSNGNWGGCTSTSFEVIGGPSVSMTPGCGGYCTAQQSMGAGTTFGGDVSWHGSNCMCWSYLRWNTGCTNSAGISGPGGDPGPAGTAYNTPGSSQYVCSTCDMSNCARFFPARPGNFPGGGGASGNTRTCCYMHSSGGAGAPGYVRIIY